ncbi:MULTISPECIES: HEAT repeat domain-containing protein [Rahnella]|uniref:HEAT repeat domain-containing protein n=1 Tax=Rahnella laticis TaxID=2787622 RepID=A0ABS0E0W2_9GAMM|nr:MULTISPECIES: HEAT repeat domain-containing protein [Rahnella]MBF7978743.1 HEAT repeat domain-containing protein [Rahnella laticis]MBF7998833.1 HEAT repeat domain-containing protein [Rahnella sp. LAC-M12]
MATEYYLLRQLEMMMADPENWDYSYSNETDPRKRLECLTRHYNGHIRQRAVLSLGLMKEGEALPSIIKRVNDWVSQVRDAARQSIRQFMTPESAGWLVECLPDFYALLNTRRDNHALLVDEIVSFLARPEHCAALMTGLASPQKDVARHALALLLEHHLLAVDVIFESTRRHKNAAVRLAAARALLAQPELVTQERLLTLLKDRYAPVKQAALTHVTDKARDVPVSLLLELLCDRNEVVRKRAAKLLIARGQPVLAHYLSIFSDENQKLPRRRIALSGLDEQKYENVLALAADCLKSSNKALCKTALQITVHRLQENAREVLLEAMAHPAYPVAIFAFRNFVKLKLYIRLSDIQQNQLVAPSVKHQRLYFSLAARLNRSDRLQFLLMNADNADAALLRQMLAQ